MIDFLGIKDIDELFEDLPSEVRIDGLNLPPAMDEKDVEDKVRKIISKNKTFYEMLSFLPILKPHYIPAAVYEIVARQEFYTSYTPYQAEASQGMLQALFEYQSVVAELTGMDVANASMYDSATALGEAALMAERIKKKGGIAIPSNISYRKKAVLKNYVKGAGIKIFEMPYKNGLPVLKKFDGIDAIYIESPNFFGLIDDRKEIIENASDNDALLIFGTDPLFLSIFNPPEYADIVIGEGYLGNPMNFGGPLLGIFACKRKYIRQMPGRIIGATVDKEGKRAFTSILQTREQHIRRGKATSNICSNEALCAVSFLAYVAVMGRNGLRRIAIQNRENAHYMALQLEKIGFELPFEKKFFNEFVAVSPVNAKKLNENLLKKGMQNGLLLDEVANGILYGVTEMHDKAIINNAIEKIKEAMEEIE